MKYINSIDELKQYVGKFICFSCIKQDCQEADAKIGRLLAIKTNGLNHTKEYIEIHPFGNLNIECDMCIYYFDFKKGTFCKVNFYGNFTNCQEIRGIMIPSCEDIKKLRMEWRKRKFLNLLYGYG